MSGDPSVAWWRRGRPLPHPSGPEVLDPDIEPDPPQHHARASLPHVGLVFLGGLVGTLARYAVLDHAAAPLAGLPWPVLLINVSGSFVLGLVGAVLFERRPHLVGTRLFLSTGVLGGWTTYSSVIAGSLTLDHHGYPVWTTATLVVSVLTTLLAAALGLWAGRWYERERLA